MSNKPQHKISEYLKSQFDANSNKDLGWNSPPDFLFEEAISTITNDRQKKKKRLLFFFSALGLLSAVLLNQLYSAHKLNDLETKINHLVSEKQSDEKTKELKNTIPANTAKESKEKDSKKEVNKSQTFSSTTNSNSHSKLNSKEIKNQHHIPVQKVNEETTGTEKNTSFESLLLKRQLNNNLNPLSRINLSSLLSNNNRDELLYSKSLSNIETKSKKFTRRAKLGFYILNNLSTMKMTAPISDQQSLTDYDKYYSGIGIGVEYLIPIVKKISIKNSFTYRRIHNQSIINTTLQYSKANEVIMGSNMAMYDMDNTLETPMGTLVERMQLVVDPTLTSEGDMLHQSTSMDQCLSIINFSTGIDASIVSVEKLDWHAGMQIGINYISNLENTFLSRYEIDGKMMGENNSTLKSISNNNHIFGSVIFNTGFSYSLSNNLELSIGGTYEKSLNSLRTSSNNSKTFLVNWASQLGLKKSF